jgi:hypothetical protein
LVEQVGGSNEEKTAVAYALFAFWARTYNQGLTPVHTFHETMDVAYNFGVPYKAFHYPGVVSGKLDLMNPGRYEPMSGNAGQVGRWDEFRRRLDLVPRVPRPPRVPVSARRQASELDVMYVGTESTGGKQAASSSQPGFSPDEFVLRRNAGGGDCLFYALEGHDLTPRELLDLRRQVADERRRMPARGNINAWNMIAALHQTPETRDSAQRLMADRDEVPNEVYAAMQEVPGIYAGDDELIQYCRLRGISVAVVSWDGELQIANANGIQRIAYGPGGQTEALRRALAETDMALYKSPGHWERIDGAREPELTDALALVPNAPQPSILRMSQQVRDAFRILGLGLGQFDDVTAAFRRRARSSHPDKQGEQATEHFKRLVAARDLLETIAQNPAEKDKVRQLALTDT